MNMKVIIKRDGKEYELTYAELLEAHQVFENRMVIDKLVEALAARMCDEDDEEDAAIIGSIRYLYDAVEKAIENDIDKYLDSYIYEYQCKYDTSLDAAVEWFVDESGMFWPILDTVIESAKNAAHAESAEA